MEEDLSFPDLKAINADCTPSMKISPDKPPVRKLVQKLSSSVFKSESVSERGGRNGKLLMVMYPRLQERPWK